jgi:hypothetical protein
MSQTVINSAETLSKFLGDVREAWHRHKYLRVTIKTGKDRSLDMNALLHAWIAQIERELREDDALAVKRFCKLHFGVAILRAEDDDFRAMYDQTFKRLDYDAKLKAMDYLPVTSIMTNAQLKQMLVAMQEAYAKRGVVLEFPPEDEPKRGKR